MTTIRRRNGGMGTDFFSERGGQLAIKGKQIAQFHPDKQVQVPPNYNKIDTYQFNTRYLRQVIDEEWIRFHLRILLLNHASCQILWLGPSVDASQKVVLRDDSGNAVTVRATNNARGILLRRRRKLLFKNTLKT